MKDRVPFPGWEIEIRQFRNLEVRARIPSLPVLIVGPNGSGKTSFLEALYILGKGRSFRSRRKQSLIRVGRDSAWIRLKKGDGESLELVIRDRFRLSVMNQRCSWGEWSGRWPVFFLGGRFWELIPMIPAWRRRILDESVEVLVRGYRAHWIRFAQALKRRNRVLREFGGDLSQRDLYATWTDLFLQAAYPVWKARFYLVRNLARVFAIYWRMFFPEIEIRMALRPGNLDLDDLDRDFRVEELRERLAVDAEEEIRRGTTLFGPQRDDLVVETRRGVFWETASAGQVRAFLLAWALALDDLSRSLNRKPLLILLDDFDAELDEKRCRQWLQGIVSRRVVMTTHREVWQRERMDFRVFSLRGGELVSVSNGESEQDKEWNESGMDEMPGS